MELMEDDWGLEPLESPEPSNYQSIAIETHQLELYAFIDGDEGNRELKHYELKEPSTEESSKRAAKHIKSTLAQKKGRKQGKATLLLHKFQKPKKITGGYKVPNKEGLRMGAIEDLSEQ